jgi:hypothetical protein
VADQFGDYSIVLYRSGFLGSYFYEKSRKITCESSSQTMQVNLTHESFYKWACRNDISYHGICRRMCEEVVRLDLSKGRRFTYKL